MAHFVQFCGWSSADAFCRPPIWSCSSSCPRRWTVNVYSVAVPLHVLAVYYRIIERIVSEIMLLLSNAGVPACSNQRQSDGHRIIIIIISDGCGCVLSNLFTIAEQNELSQKRWICELEGKARYRQQQTMNHTHQNILIPWLGATTMVLP